MIRIVKQFTSIFLLQLNGNLPCQASVIKWLKILFLNEKQLLTCIFHRVDSDTAFCPCQTSGKYHSNILQTVHGTAHRSAVPLNNDKHQYKHKFRTKIRGIIAMVGPALAAGEGELSSLTCWTV